MRTFSRALARWDMLRVAAAAVGVALLLLIAAFVAGSIAAAPHAGSVLAALSAAAIAGAGILYAWREPAA
jgi:hypothetical protein